MDKYHYKTCGLDEVYLLNGYEVIEYGGEKAVSIHNVDQLHEVIGLTIAHKHSCLTGREFRFLRLEMDQSQKMISVMFDVTDQTVANWEKKDVVPTMPDALIRAVYVESLGEDSEVKKLLDVLAKVDRAIHRSQMLIEEAAGGWALKTG